jgi:hypothetical protein
MARGSNKHKLETGLYFCCTLSDKGVACVQSEGFQAQKDLRYCASYQSLEQEPPAIRIVLVMWQNDHSSKIESTDPYCTQRETEID